MIRRKVVDDIGTMDEGYFLYFDEVDYCNRARKAGWEIWHVPQSQLVHVEGTSTGITEVRETKPRYWFDSRRRLFLIWHGFWGLLGADLCWFLGHVLRVSKQALPLGGNRQKTSSLKIAVKPIAEDLRAAFTRKLFSAGER